MCVISAIDWNERTYIDGLNARWQNRGVPSSPSTTGERVKARRKDLGISQGVLAERAGLSRDTIRRLEGGDPIGTANLQRVADALSVALIDLIGVAGRVALPVDPPKMDRLQRIIEAYAAADEEDRQSLERQAAYVETSTALKRERPTPAPTTADQPTDGRPDGLQTGASSGRRQSATRTRK